MTRDHGPLCRAPVYWVMTALVVFLSMTSAKAADNGLRINEVVSANVTGLPDEPEPDLSNCPVPDCEQWHRDLGSSVFDGEYPDWIELFNAGDSPVSLQGYGLSDDPDRPFKWTFPDAVVPANGFLVVFASGKNKADADLHTNFKISSGGETIVLTAPSGQESDRVAAGQIPIDCSLGRLPGQPESWAWFDEPTPGAPNTTPVFPGYTDEIWSSLPAGLYVQPVDLALTARNAGAEIRFTLDGEEPGPESSLYTTPLAIPESRVVRARVFAGGRPASPVFTGTYFIGESFHFPVISLSTRPEHLWDPDLGIYAAGRNANESQRIANYWQDWERPVHVELFETNGARAFAINAGLRIFGWGSRSHPQKSLAVMLRDRYGTPELRHRLFPDLGVARFTSFVLRAGGSDAVAKGAFFRDPLASSLLHSRNLDWQAFRPAIVFINGEYWGIQDIREKLNEDYVNSHHGVDPKAVDMISRYWRRADPVVFAGTDEAYRELEELVSTQDLAAPSAADALRAALDIDSFLDYTAAQIVLGNYDWPGNNNKLWRSRDPAGRWRWLIYDLDYAFGFGLGAEGASHDTLVHATHPDSSLWSNLPHTTLLIRKLLEAPSIRTRFINRVADLLNADFLPERTLAQLEKFQALYQPEMPRHIGRWAGTGDVIPSISAWNQNIETVRTFLQHRPEFVRQHLARYFQLPGTQEVRLAIDPPGAGRLKLNSLLITNASWSGAYFKGVPIQVDVLPAPGFRFAGWDGSGEAVWSGASRLTLTVDGAPIHEVARFEPEPGAVNAVVIHEINYHAPKENDPGDWVELHNAYAVPVDLSEWVLKDSEEGHAFVLPEGTILEAGGFLVLCADLASFRHRFPGVSNALGDLGFALGNSGDTVRLYDSRKNLVNQVDYTDRAPWPASPDGRGPTLSLVRPELDNTSAASWRPSASALGSPGAANVTSEDEQTPLALIAALRSGTLQIRFPSVAGREYTLQASEDFRQWSEAKRTAGTGSTVALSFNLANERAARFYRVIVSQME